MNTTFFGVIAPMVTPFDSDGICDDEALRSETRFLIDAGVHGLSIGGSTGEGALLSDEELYRGVRIIQKENIEKKPLLCGIIRNSTNDAIRAGLHAREAGADGLMVTPTYYHGTDDNGNILFYKELAGAVGLPIIIYNVIDRNPVSPSLMARLSEIENVAGIKQSVNGLHGLNAMISACGEQTLVFGAQDDLLFCSYLLGARGAISAILTVFPELCVQQWNAVQSMNIEEARQISFRLLPVWQLIASAGMSFPGRIKAVLELLGRQGGLSRSPIMKPSQEVVEALRSALEKAGLLPGPSY